MPGRNAWGAGGDEYIDSLRVHQDPPGFRAYESSFDGIPLGPTARNTRRIKQPGRRLTGRKAWGTIVGFMALAGCLGCCGILGSIARSSPVNIHSAAVKEQSPSPEPVVTVTVTSTTAPTIPESCKEAIQQAIVALDSASRISSVSGTQLDIISKATQAILNKDQAKLNEAADEQRRLESSTAHDAATVQIPFQQIQDGLATCP